MSDLKNKSLLIASATACMIASATPDASAAPDLTTVRFPVPGSPRLGAASRPVPTTGSIEGAVSAPPAAPSFSSIAAFQKGRESLADRALHAVLLSGVVAMAGGLLGQLLG